MHPGVHPFIVAMLGPHTDTYRHPRYMTDLPLRDGPVESEFHVHWEEAPSSVTLWSVVGGAALTSTGVLEVLEGAYYWLAL